MPSNSIRQFVSRALGYHVSKGNLSVSADSGRYALTATGRVWFAGRLNDSPDGGALIKAAHAAMRDGAVTFHWNGSTYRLELVDAKAMRLPRTIKSYLAAEHLSAGSTVSQAFFSGIWV